MSVDAPRPLTARTHIGLRRQIALAILLASLLVVTLCSAPMVLATDYRDWRSQVAALTDDLAEGADPAGIAADLRTLSAEPVTLGAKQQRVDISGVLTLLEHDPPDIDAAVVALDSLLEATASDAAAADPDAARASLDEVLNRPEFTGDLPDPDDGNVVTRWIDQQIERVFGWLGNEESSSSSWTRMLLTLLGVALVIGLIGLLIQAIRRARAPKDANAARIDLPDNTSAQEARAEAERFAGVGDYRTALRWLYVATLLRWQEAGRLRVEDSATNHEVLAEVRARGDRTGVRVLSPLIDHFERVWYGDAPCDAQDYGAFSNLATQAWQHVGNPPAAVPTLGNEQPT